MVKNIVKDILIDPLMTTCPVEKITIINATIKSAKSRNCRLINKQDLPRPVSGIVVMVFWNCGKCSYYSFMLILVIMVAILITSLIVEIDIRLLCFYVNRGIQVGRRRG
jgi:hypothetical protein